MKGYPTWTENLDFESEYDVQVHASVDTVLSSSVHFQSLLD